ncbi:Transcription repressor OFP1 [Bienertia sinuspersici]
MGKYRFKLSNMMPNAWFYKLKDMASKTVKPCSSPTKSQTNTTNTSITNSKHPKPSTEPLFKFTDPLYSSPRNYSRASDARSSASPCRKSSHHVHARTRNKRTRMYKQKTDSCCSADQPIYYSLSSSELGSPEFSSVPNDCIRRSGDFGVELLMFDELGSWSSSSVRSSCSCCCRISSSTTDIIIDLKHHDNQTHEESNINRKFQQLNEFDAASELELRPILTKLPTGNELKRIGDNNEYVRKLKSRKPSLSDSFAIVKSSIDPHRDFKDSMVEMILENNLRGFKDLENLLACYLSLNCKEYHPLIVNAFEQIWLDVICST